MSKTKDMLMEERRWFCGEVELERNNAVRDGKLYDVRVLNRLLAKLRKRITLSEVQAENKGFDKLNQKMIAAYNMERTRRKFLGARKQLLPGVLKGAARRRLADAGIVFHMEDALQEVQHGYFQGKLAGWKDAAKYLHTVGLDKEAGYITLMVKSVEKKVKDCHE